MRRLLPVLFLAACGSDSPSLAVEDHCNPLGTNHCMTPWPSSAFEIEDGATATGRRLAIPAGTLPTNASGVAIDPAPWNRADGFSPAAPMVVSFPGGISSEGLVHYDDFAASITDASPTVIVDMETGERIVHFAELDAPAAADPDRQALYLRPAQRLAGGHRYAVALRRSLRAAGGGDLPISDGFQALLDGTATSHPLLEAMRPGFGDVLDALEGAGVGRDDLLLAWDFTAASDEFVFDDALVARDRALAAMDASPPGYEVLGDQPVDDGSVIRRRIIGELDAPLLLTNDGAYRESTRLARDGDGKPEVVGTYRIPFTAIVPACAYDALAPVGIMVYGHGLMGEHEQAASGAIRTTAAEICVVTVGTDMRGMSSADIGQVASALTDFNYGDPVFEGLIQGLVNHVALVRAAQGAMAAELFVDEEGASLVDPAKVYYYGLSQGHIFGTSVIAYDPEIERGVVGVGGGNYSMMLERSSDWPTYRTIVYGAYPDTLDLVLLIGLMQMRWDHTETAGIAHVVLDGAPLGVSPKQVLVHMAIGDDEVPNISTHWQARTMGIPVLSPSVEEPFGLELAEGPQGSALVIMDGAAPAIPAENVPAPTTGMHSLTRNQPATWRQMARFYETGEIVNECDGACFCAEGACE
jgi:hypothetical protein